MSDSLFHLSYKYLPLRLGDDLRPDTKQLQVQAKIPPFTNQMKHQMAKTIGGGRGG